MLNSSFKSFDEISKSLTTAHSNLSEPLTKLRKSYLKIQQQILFNKLQMPEGMDLTDITRLIETTEEKLDVLSDILSKSFFTSSDIKKSSRKYLKYKSKYLKLKNNFI